MEKLDKIFDKFNGAYLFFIIIIVSIVSSIISNIFFLPTNPTFSMFTNYISDMGAGPIETKITMAVGDLFVGILLILLILFIARDMEKKQVNLTGIYVTLTIGIIMAIATIFLGLFPLDPAIPIAFTVHVIVAIIYFGATTFTFIIYGTYQFKLKEFPNYLAILSYISGILAAIFLVGFMIQEFTAVPPQTFVYLVEWIQYYFIAIWAVVHGIYFLRNK